MLWSSIKTTCSNGETIAASSSCHIWYKAVAPDGTDYMTSDGTANVSVTATPTGGTPRTLSKLITFEYSNLLIAGGFFTADGGATTMNGIAKWNGTAWAQVGDGFNASVYALTLDKSGDLIAGGDFTADDGGTTAMSYIAKWNGTAWAEVGDGFNKLVNALTLDKSGDLIAGGSLPRMVMMVQQPWTSLRSGMGLLGRKWGTGLITGYMH